METLGGFLLRMKQKQLTVTYKRTEDLIPYVNNARTHSDEQVTQIASSIKEFGFNNPILTDGENGVIAGHGRLLAAKKLGLETVPTIELSGLTEAQKKAYILADNKIALNSGWDEEILKLELDDLHLQGIDLETVGFSDEELQSIITPPVLAEDFDDDEISEDKLSEALTIEPISFAGSAWRCGRHLVICGDSTIKDNVTIDTKEFDLLLTDPPYGISIVSSSGNVVGGGALHFGEVGGGNIVKTRKYLPVKNDETTETALKAIELAKGITKNQIIFCGNYFSEVLPSSPCWLVWDKQNTGNFADCELAWTSFKTAVRKFEWMWNGLARQGIRAEEGKERIHPTQKPVGLLAEILEKYSQANQTVLDMFGGSGSTLIACEKTNRICTIVEYEPAYVDLIVKRWQEYTGQKAVDFVTGKEFDDLCQERKLKSI